jgi:hypothetical protein
MNEKEIRAAINDITQETLADALALFLTEDKKPRQTAAGTDKPELTNFAQAVLYLKHNFDFPELDFFSTEADLVYVKSGERKILLTDRINSTAGVLNYKANSKETAFDNEVSGVDAREKSVTETRTTEQDGGRFSNLEI